MRKSSTIYGLTIKIIIAAFTVIILLGIIRNVKASALPGPAGQLTCTSVRVEQGDTLWSIAREYYTDDYDSFEEYIDVIKKTNNMTTDRLYKGCYIIVPHY